MQIFKYKFELILLLVVSFLSFQLPDTHAQPPLYFSYQAVISDASGDPVQGNVAIKISILRHSADTDPVYIERHVKETDKNGFVSLRIGDSENVYKGEFDTIVWDDGPYFMKLDIDPDAGFTYPISSVTELLSVPYAMYATRADSISEDFKETDPEFMNSVAYAISAEDTARWNLMSRKSKFNIGDYHQGGIIFYLEPDGKHGLIVLPDDLSDNIRWSDQIGLVNASSSYDGKTNTSNIISELGSAGFAAFACDTLNAGNYNDWYLPSIDELSLLFQKKYLINSILFADEDESTEPIDNNKYWSSTEKDDERTYIMDFGAISIGNKNEEISIRPIRAF